MDLLDFSDCELYFDVPMPAAAEQLLAQASAEYGDPSAETALLRAHLLAPENLTVLVGLYRYYFYQHRLDDADREFGDALARTAADHSAPIGVATAGRAAAADGVGGVGRRLRPRQRRRGRGRAHAASSVRTGDRTRRARRATVDELHRGARAGTLCDPRAPVDLCQLIHSCNFNPNCHSAATRDPVVRRLI